MITVNGDNFYKEKEVQAKYGLSVHWLRRARYGKFDSKPKYHKLNGKVFYKEKDIEQWFLDSLEPVG